MKISVLTPTYNRATLLENLYKSIIKQSKKIEVEWLIMDDESKDNTKEQIEKFKKDNKIEIKYFYQKNSGKMKAINNLVLESTGDLIVECDSDDYFTEDAFVNIEKAFEENKNRKDIYAMCFLKYDTNGNNMGNDFKNKETTMFNLYFSEGEDGEKALVYFSNIRKNYSYELEQNEKFVTEARMHHKMDLKYKIVCYNTPIMFCEYKKDGYTKNIKKVFKENPYGYYEYFKEILQRNMNGVTLRKRLYVIKHYILFSVLTNKKIQIKEVREVFNKMLILCLYIPGKIKSNNYKKS